MQQTGAGEYVSSVEPFSNMPAADELIVWDCRSCVCPPESEAVPSDKKADYITIRRPCMDLQLDDDMADVNVVCTDYSDYHVGHHSLDDIPKLARDYGLDIPADFKVKPF